MSRESDLIFKLKLKVFQTLTLIFKPKRVESELSQVSKFGILVESVLSIKKSVESSQS